MRSLNSDSYRASRIGLILAIVNMLALLAWFFFAKVTLYEVSDQVEFTQQGSVVALFSKDAMARIFPGQNALFKVDAGQDQPLVSLPSLVIDAPPDANQVELLIVADEIPIGLTEIDLGGKATVEVEVEYVTPAELVMRASGKFFSRSEVPVSPQNIQPGER